MSPVEYSVLGECRAACAARASFDGHFPVHGKRTRPPNGPRHTRLSWQSLLRRIYRGMCCSQLRKTFIIFGNNIDRIAPQSRRSRGRTSRRTAVPRAPRHRETAAQRSRGDAADGSCLRHYHRHHAADFDLQLAPTSPPAIGGRIVLLLRGDFSSRATSFCHPQGWMGSYYNWAKDWLIESHVPVRL